MFLGSDGEADFSVANAGDRVFHAILSVASGRPTLSETNKNGNFPNIFSIGPVL
jgi:altronate dehydratase